MKPVMAEMVGSAVIQEAVSRGVSFMLGKRKKASQGHMMERLEMTVSHLEFALERSAKLPITDVSLIHRRKMVKCAYIEAAELLDKHKQQPMQGQEEITQGLKHKRPWIFRPKNFSFSSSASLKMGDVQRFEWFADCAGKFVRDVESSCSLRHYNFCNPIVRHLLQGKTLWYKTEQGDRLRGIYIRPTYSEERGVEAMLGYGYEDRTMAGKTFALCLIMRLSESIDIVQVAIQGLHLLTSQFKLAAESAMGELAMLASNLQDIAQSNVPLLSVGNRVQEWHVEHTQLCRPDPTCCKAFRHGHSANNIVSSELSHIFPEQVIYLAFHGYISALEPGSSSSSNEVGSRSINRGWTLPLEVGAGFVPHFQDEMLQLNGSVAVKMIGNVEEYRDASIQQVAETLKSDAINYFSRHQDMPIYKMMCFSNHGGALFQVKRAGIKRMSWSPMFKSKDIKPYMWSKNLKCRCSRSDKLGYYCFSDAFIALQLCPKPELSIAP